ncbi:ABC-2 family transporter protein [Phenylobacterium sp.]|uniref:ABC transporter permease n=1 Tax=Phenylobacterium sp. TaxID=1871053 RepID=UPI0027371F55|nr:ABC-2 family transporter protein [Phenylobacterium sp.]MDP3854362.1 ABC-2 family transporter protein [Phenylobacterium sp.]
MTDALRPYAAAFAARFQLMLQYRAAAVAGFATQCWWGGIKVMVYAAFFAGASAADTPITLSQVITYTWLAQAFLVLSPWGGDPEISQAVRTGAIGYERLRPIDTYAWWYVRAAAWATARALPRALLMLAVAGVALPLLGLEEWSWRPPADALAFGLFTLSMMLVVLVSAAFVMLLNIAAVTTMDERGINTLVAALIIAFSGNLLPLALYPDWMQTFLFIQPFASFLDIPFRIYFGGLTGWSAAAGLALQAFWTVVMVVVGRAWMVRVMAKLQMQGG